MRAAHHLTVIMFTDIVGYTRLMGRDESLAIKILRVNREIHKRLITKYSGVYVKEMGDGCMAKFSSASNATYCAGEIMAALKASFPEQNLKIGIHLGEVVEENGDIFGDGVNIAARIESSAKPGQILVSNPVFDNLINKNGIDGKLVGPLSLKNVDHPVILHEVWVDSFPEYQEESSDTKKEVKSIFISKRFILTLAISAFVLSGVFLSNLFLNKEGEPIGVILDDDKLAVLHFTNQTGDEELDVVGPMISHWLTEGFIQNGDVKVVSNDAIQRAYASTSKMDIGSKAKDQLINELGTNQVIEGSYFLQGDSIYVKSELVNVSNGAISYSFGTFKGHKSEPIPIIEALRETVLGYWYNQENIQRYPAPKFSAYKKYIEAILLWGEDDGKVHSLLEESIKLDPNFNEPLFLHIALHRNKREWATCDSIITLLEDKKNDLTKAQTEKLRFFKYELEGDYTTAYKYLLSDYKRDESDLFMNSSVANFAMFNLNDYEEAIRVASLIDLDKIDFEDCHYCKYRLYILSTALLKAGRYEEALDVCAYNPSLEPDFRVHKIEILSQLHLGNYHAVDSIVAALERKNSDGRNILISNMLSTESEIIGNMDEAKKWEEHVNTIYKYDSIEDQYAVEEYVLSRIKLSEYEEVESILNQLVATYPSDFYYQNRLAYLYLLKGANSKADRLKEKFENARKDHDFGKLEYSLGVMEALSGEKEQAINHLRNALKDGKVFSLHSFDRDWYLKSLWNEPEFKKLLSTRHVDKDI